MQKILPVWQYLEDKSIFIYGKERKKCAADYPAGELGGAVGL